MSDDELRWLHAAANAMSGLDADDGGPLRDARCPKCNASTFVNGADLYYEAAGRLEEAPDAPAEIRVGGMTDDQIVRRLRPPRRKSALRIALLAALPFAAGGVYVLRRFGTDAGEFALVGGFIIVLIVFMARLRRYSDDYYDRRKRWRSLHVCAKCGQLVAG